jgi:t-SNARE complex subunit (syntaxin)
MKLQFRLLRNTSNNLNPDVATEANRSSLVHHKHHIDSYKKNTKDYSKTMNCNCLYLYKHSMAHASTE